ncbi:hypothetical protein ACH4LT_15720 [Streptomyces clavifer]|uniref:hypothetical protein n=1 Tax=Streptomyces clavifer TaxID=68188 RepID=UPI0037ADE5FF
MLDPFVTSTDKVDGGTDSPGVRPDVAAERRSGGRPPLQLAFKAIRVLKDLDAENRPTIDVEKRTPAHWPGWGSVPNIFATEPNEEQPRYQQSGAERARRQPLSESDDPKTALAAVVAAHGEVDPGEIARMLDLDPQETLKRLSNEVFTDPDATRLAALRRRTPAV